MFSFPYYRAGEHCINILVSTCAYLFPSYIIFLGKALRKLLGERIHCILKLLINRPPEMLFQFILSLACL